MKEIMIYSSKNNGYGGEIDLNTSPIFTEDSKYCCLYIKNEAQTAKRLLKLLNNSVEEFLFHVVTDDAGKPLLNTLSNEGEHPTDNYTNTIDIEGTILNSLDFITVWVKPTTNVSDVKLEAKRSLNIVVEYVDEY